MLHSDSVRGGPFGTDSKRPKSVLPGGFCSLAVGTKEYMLRCQCEGLFGLQESALHALVAVRHLNNLTAGAVCGERKTRDSYEPHVM
jgi:hypothetical protein